MKERIGGKMDTLKWIFIMPVIILIDILLYLGGIFSTRIRAAYLLSVCKKYGMVVNDERQ